MNNTNNPNKLTAQYAKNIIFALEEEIRQLKDREHEHIQYMIETYDYQLKMTEENIQLKNILNHIQGIIESSSPTEASIEDEADEYGRSYDEEWLRQGYGIYPDDEQDDSSILYIDVGDASPEDTNKILEEYWNEKTNDPSKEFIIRIRARNNRK